MLNKKLRKILGLVLGVSVFMTSLGLGQVKALADDNVNKNSEIHQNTNSKNVKDYSININKTVEQNGFKITLDKVIGTKHKVKVQVKIESSNPIGKENYNNLISEITFGKSNCFSGGAESCKMINDKTLLLTKEKEIDDEEFPEKGELRVDIVIPNYKINVGIDANVDFSESFKNTLKKDVNTKIPEFDFNIDNMESDVMGTTINYSSQWEENEELINSPHSCILVKYGDKMYKINRHGSSSSESGEVNGQLECKALTYDKIKDANECSIIPISCDISYDEENKIYGDSIMEYYKKQDSMKVTLNNVKYIKSFEFDNGSKGEIYNIERNDNTVKIYCKGNTEKESLLMASNMYVNCELDNDNYDCDRNMSFYKDPNDELGYIVELDNIIKDKIIDVNFNLAISKIDKYEIGNEVELFK